MNIRYWRKRTPKSSYRIFFPLYYSFSSGRIKNNPPTLSPVTSIQAFDNKDLEKDVELQELQEMGEIQRQPSVEGDAIALAVKHQEKEKIEIETLDKFSIFFPFFVRKSSPEKGYIYAPLFIRRWNTKNETQSTHVSLIYIYI